MKTAVILFNLGGPDQPSSVKPFLQNLFSDPAIISLPGFLRLPLAHFIASRREKWAQQIYVHLGGKSPLLQNTQAQAKALNKELGETFKCFVCMRYWHPFTKEVVEQVKNYKPDQIILLPLYPQFSTTTSGSSLEEWKKECRKQELALPTLEIPCYPTKDGFTSAIAELTMKALDSLKVKTNIRVLFTAHGLPKKIIKKGDPYQYHVEQTVAKIVEKVGGVNDYVICYQSRIGPLKWLQPYAHEEIKRAGREGKSLVVVPVAFVSEHSETLVELDIDYRALAEHSGVHKYVRVPTVSTHSSFIKCLSELVRKAMNGNLLRFDHYQTCLINNRKCGCSNVANKLIS